jgi:hypothetical protein
MGPFASNKVLNNHLYLGQRNVFFHAMTSRPRNFLGVRVILSRVKAMILTTFLLPLVQRWGYGFGLLLWNGMLPMRFKAISPPSSPLSSPACYPPPALHPASDPAAWIV